MNIAPEDPLREDVAALLAIHHAFGNSQSPPEDAHALDPGDLLDPALTLLSARDEGGSLLGVGALRDLGGGHGELKAMHVRVAARGTGVGRAILEALVALARERGFDRLSLETGAMAAFAPARALYAAAGFEPCAPFGEYGPSRHSTYMTRSLD